MHACVCGPEECALSPLSCWQGCDTFTISPAVASKLLNVQVGFAASRCVHDQPKSGSLPHDVSTIIVQHDALHEA